MIISSKVEDSCRPMKKFPRISIITPSYNQGKFLSATIQSVLDQNYPNLQYIIIDGGSTDTSVDVIKRFQGNIDYWVSEPDSGQSEAINKGLAHATGEIVAWINSDDLLLPGALEAAAKEWQADPTLALLSADCIRIGPQHNFLFWHSVPRQTHWFAKHGIIYIDQPGTFWRRDFFDSPDVIDTQLTGLMDHDLWYRIVLGGGKTKCIKTATAAFRYHPNSKTTNMQDAFKKEALILRRRYCPDWPFVPSYAILLYRIWKLINGSYLRKAWLTHNPDKAIHYYLGECPKAV